MSDATVPAKTVIDLRRFDALLADLDGVVAKTAAVHAAAWKQLFDEYLRRRAELRKEVFAPFDIEADYRRLVDGKPRAAGVRSFLASRAITLPDGSLDDGPDAETVSGLGNRKNLYFHERLRHKGRRSTSPRWRCCGRLVAAGADLRWSRPAGIARRS